MKKSKLFGLVVIILLIALDLITKHLAETNIGLYQQVSVIPNFFWLTNVRNTGAAWSLFDGKVGLLSVVSFVASVILVFVYLKDKQSKLANTALVLMIAGTIGNFYDRLVLNYVRDFLSFNLFGYMFPVFNIADSLLVIGVVLLIVEVFLDEKRNRG